MKGMPHLLALLLVFSAPTTATSGGCGTPPLADPPCYGIGPGALMHAEAGTSCTTAFLIRNESSVFIWTAGHCTREVGQRVWFYYPEPGMTDQPVEMEKRPADGIVVYRPGEPGDNEVPPPLDYALVELNRAVWKWLRPAMPVWPGPTEVATDWDREPAPIHLYGHVLSGTSLEARTGVGPVTVDERTFTFDMAVQNGDSGAPVVSETGEALGIAVWFDAYGLADGDGLAIAVRLDHAMDQAREEADLNLTLLRPGDALPDHGTEDAATSAPVDSGRGRNAPGLWLPLVGAILLIGTRRRYR